MSRTLKERDERGKREGGERKAKSKEQKCRAIFSLDVQGHSVQKQGASECQFLLRIQDIIAG